MTIITIIAGVITLALVCFLFYKLFTSDKS